MRQSWIAKNIWSRETRITPWRKDDGEVITSSQEVSPPPQTRHGSPGAKIQPRGWSLILRTQAKTQGTAAAARWPHVGEAESLIIRKVNRVSRQDGAGNGAPATQDNSRKSACKILRKYQRWVEHFFWYRLTTANVLASANPGVTKSASRRRAASPDTLGSDSIAKNLLDLSARQGTDSVGCKKEAKSRRTMTRHRQRFRGGEDLQKKRRRDPDAEAGDDCRNLGSWRVSSSRVPRMANPGGCGGKLNAPWPGGATGFRATENLEPPARSGHAPGEDREKIVVTERQRDPEEVLM